MNECSTKPSNILNVSEGKQNLARNTLVSVLLFVFSMATSIFMVPYQMHHLGLANYGMVVLANSFASYFSLITLIFVGNAYRFVTVELARNDIKAAQSYLNTQFISAMGFVFVALPILCLVAYLTPRFLNVPRGQEGNTQITFAVIFAGFLLSQFNASFQVAFFARQRFDYRDLIEIGNQTVRYSIWIIFFSLFTPIMWHVGLGYIGGALLALTISVVLASRLLPEVKPQLRGFDINKFKEMAKMGTWAFIIQLGMVLFLSIDNFLINKTLGPESVGRYSAVLGLVIMMNSVFSTFCGLIVPMVTSKFARGEIDLLEHNVMMGVRLVTAGMAFVCGLICGLSVPLLTLWLGPEFSSLSKILWLLMGACLLNNSIHPIISIFTAANKLATQGVITIACGIAKVFFALALLRFTDLGLLGFAIAYASISLVHVILMTQSALKMLKISRWSHIKTMIRPVMGFVIIGIVGSFATHLILIDSIVKLAATVLVISVIAAGLIWLLLLNKKDKEFLLETMLRRHIVRSTA